MAGAGTGPLARHQLAPRRREITVGRQCDGPPVDPADVGSDHAVSSRQATRVSLWVVTDAFAEPEGRSRRAH